MSDAIAVSLFVPGTPVAAGGTLKGTLTVQNRSQQVDRLVVQVAGVDPAWCAVTPTEVNLFPGDQEQIQLDFHPPRAGSSRAGRHPVTITVRSSAHPDQSSAAQFELDVLPFYATTLELRPRRVTASGTGSFTLVAGNQGNAPAALQFAGEDDEAALEYRFDPPQPTVAPGSTQNIALAVAARPNWQGQARSFFFAVTGQVPGTPDKARAQGEWVATLPPPPPKRKWWPIVLAVLAAVCLCAALAYAAVSVLPGLVGDVSGSTGESQCLNPPRIYSFTATPALTRPGNEVLLEWSVAPQADMQVIIAELGGRLSSKGSMSVQPDATTTYTLVATNCGGTSTAEATVTVR